jgi:putative SOS response-associated peptidase YedK
MCFSIQVDRDIKKLAQRFKASISIPDFNSLQAVKDYEAQIGPDKIKAVLGLKRKPKVNVFKTLGIDNRIFPGYFAPVITTENNQRVIKPMRYRVRPAGSIEEIPSKFNVFNARLDSLEKRKTWSPLFMRQHGLLPFVKFFEWVKDEDKKKLITFSPESHEIMWAPCLWDKWQSADGKIEFYSFAVITDDPPKEIADMGHDRCPIFIKEELIDQWLNPTGSKKEIYALLKQVEKTYFNYQWAA